MVTPRLPTTPAPAPVERYAVQFDDVFVSRSQRQAFRDVMVGLLRPRDRNKTLTALADVEPGRAGAQHCETQRLHRFLAESPWDVDRVNTRRIHRYLTQKRKDEGEKSTQQGQIASFLPPVWQTILACFVPLKLPFRLDGTYFSF